MDSDHDSESSCESQAELTLRLPADRAILVEWECPDEADQDVQLRFDRGRDAVLDALAHAFVDFQELSSSGTDRVGHQHLGDATSFSDHKSLSDKVISGEIHGLRDVYRVH